MLPLGFSDVQRQNLGCGGGIGFAADQPQRAALPPLFAIVVARSRHVIQKVDDGINRGELVHGTNSRADHKAHFRQAGLRLFLDELIIGRGAAEAPRQHVLDQPDQIRAEEVHAFAGQLLVAADGMQVHAVAELVQEAAALPLLEHAVVVALDIDHQLGRVRQQRRVDVDRHLGTVRERLLALDQRDLVEQEVNVVHGGRPGAGNSEPPGLTHAVVGHDPTTGRVHGPHLALGQRFAAAPNHGADDVEPALAGRQANPHGRGRVGVQERRRPCPHLGRQPFGNAPGLVHGHVLGCWRVAPVQAHRGEGVASQQRVPPSARPKPQTVLCEPLLHGLADHHVAQRVAEARHIGRSGAPDGIRPPPGIEQRVEEEVIGYFARLMLQAIPDRRAAAARATALTFEMSVGKGVVEIARAHLELKAAPADRPAPLELVQMNVHARGEQRLQRRLQARRRHRLFDIVERDPGMVQELAIRALRPGVDAEAQHPDKIRLSRTQIAGDLLLAIGSGRRSAQQAVQTRAKAREHSKSGSRAAACDCGPRTVCPRPGARSARKRPAPPLPARSDAPWGWTVVRTSLRSPMYSAKITDSGGRSMAGAMYSRRSFCGGLAGAAAVSCCAVVTPHPALGAADACAVLSGETIRWIVPFAAGGGFDAYSRMLEPFLETALDGQVVIVNMEGADGLIGTKALMKAVPDGRTLGILNGRLIIARLFDSKIPSLTTNFTLLGHMSRDIEVWLTSAASPIHTIDDLFGNAGKIVFGVSGLNGPFVALAVGSELIGVEGDFLIGSSATSEMLLSLLRGETDVASGSWASVRTAVMAGEIRPLLQIKDDWIADDPALADVPLLGGADGVAVKRARALGRDVAEAEAKAKELSDIFIAGRFVAAPAGMSPDLAACLEQRVYEAMTDPGFVAAAKATDRPIEVANGAEAAAMLRDAERAAESLRPILERNVAKMRQ